MNNPIALPDGFTEILRCEVGSTVHGCNVADQDDHDEMGVCVETPAYMLGATKAFEQHQYRSVWERSFGNGDIANAKRFRQPRSEPGDLDLMIYSVRKWCRMALQGNPSVQLLLYSPTVIVDTRWGRELRAIAPAFASTAVLYAFMNYMREQRQRMDGTLGQKGVIRQDLIDKYGFDTKYAYHALRLGIQGIEFAKTGKLTLPMPASDRDYLIKVRTGFITLKEVLDQATLLEHDLRQLFLEPSSAMILPDEPDRAAVDAFLVRIYQECWTKDTPWPAR